MKSFIVLALLVAAAAAAPQYSSADKDAQIVRFNSDNSGDGSYNFAVETTNGIKQQEEGTIKSPGTEQEALEVRGQFSYQGPDGKIYSVAYIANEYGFQPQAEHLPVPPQ